jgi:hypothetical protein
MNPQDDSPKILPQFEPLVGQCGVLVHDPVEDVQAMLFTDRSVDPDPASTDGFIYPIDSATEIQVSRLRTPILIAVWIRDTEGNQIEVFDDETNENYFPRGDYLLEFSGMGMKIYARVNDASFRVKSTEDSVAVNFDTETTVRVGARSNHDQPGRTLKSTEEPVDLMQAVSLFGNAMKTWSPERTFPSLRGHPPLLELDNECAIPDGLTPPETGIKITIPPEHAWLYPATPLTFWLGATVEAGTPALHVDGERYPLGWEGGSDTDTHREAFEQHVRDIHQFTFLFDCAVRTEGFYDVDLDVRRRVEAVDLPLDFERLYDASIAERLKSYLELDYSFDELAARIGRPGWRLTADVQPDPKRATTLPFLARDMAVVRCPSSSKLERTSEEATEGMEDVFARSTVPSSGVLGDSVYTRASSKSDPSSREESHERVVGLPDSESMSQAWIGDGFAIGAAKASTQSYLQRLEKHAEGNSRISIDVVVNDEEMADEETVSDIYGTRDHLAFDITVHRNLSTVELAEVLENETDFVHYIGHVDPEGFDCKDGYLDADELDTVGANTFVLNACASYEQGQRLVDRGAIAGVVTLEDVINSLATKVGKTIARLLNYGFPIGSATGLIQETIFTGSNYVVVGDSNAALTQSNVPVPTVARVSLRGDGDFDVTLETYASWTYDVGTIFRPYIEGCECHYVVPGKLDTWKVIDGELDEYLDISTLPVVGRGNLYWSDEISAADLRQRLESYS